MKSASESAGAGSAMVVDWVVVVVSKMSTDDVVEGEEGGGEPSSTGLTKAMSSVMGTIVWIARSTASSF